MSKRLKLILLILLISSLGIALFLRDWYRFIHTPLLPAQTKVTYILKPGSSVKTLAYDLHRMGILSHPWYLILLAYRDQLTNRLKAGEYEFVGGILPRQMLQQIVSGQVVLHSLTLIEGWTFNQVLAAIHNNPYLKHSLKHLTEAEISQKLDLPYPIPEGWFFPDTYYFVNGMSDFEFLKRAHQKMLDVLKEEWAHRDPQVPYADPYEALIAASLIEKETHLPVERPIIAEVILQRLHKHMLLQIDSTVAYGLGPKFKGPLSKADLHHDTPYNSYLHHGLPPTPIAMPSRASIHAALHPWPGKVLYFVAKQDGSGSQQFSETLKQHQKAVANARRQIQSKQKVEPPKSIDYINCQSPPCDMHIPITDWFTPWQEQQSEQFLKGIGVH